jgi:hypothetical protein
MKTPDNTWLLTRKDLISFLSDREITDYEIPTRGKKMYIAMVGQSIEVTKEGKNYRLNHFIGN